MRLAVSFVVLYATIILRTNKPGCSRQCAGVPGARAMFQMSHWRSGMTASMPKLLSKWCQN
jgi:hypothetical protein